MKAIVCMEYGPPEVLQLKEVPQPVPREHEVLIRVHASAVTTGDCNARNAVFVPPGFGIFQRLAFGVRKPRRTIPGLELAGEIASVGAKVTRFGKGDQVFGSAGLSMGAYAEYVCLPEKGKLALKPSNLTFQEAASIPFGGVTALYFLRDLGMLQRGERILVNGASGEVGVHTVQIGKFYGAHVTGVCGTGNAEFVKSLGADDAIDYTREDFRSRVGNYDLIVDTVVGRTSFSDSMQSLKPNGRYLAVAGGLKEFGQMFWTSMAGGLSGRRTGKKVLAGSAPDRSEDLLFLKELVEAGNLKPVIDRCYPLDQIVEAHRYVDQGHKKGSVVIAV